MPIGTFDEWDVLVLVSILIISALIGIYYRYTGGKQKTTQEYLMADQSMTTFPVSFSLMASFMSAISLMGVSNESYQFGTLFGVINISYVLSTPIAAYMFLPVFYRMRTTSVYEYLERRFGHATRLAASMAFTLQMVLYMGIALYAPALALEAVTGIPRGTAILVLGLVCTFYSTLGGLKAVLITDVFQSFLMFAAIFAVIGVSAIQAGGLGAIWDVAQERGRVQYFDFSIDLTVRHTWWSLIIGGMVTYLSLYGVNQTQVQRLLSVHNLKSAQSALWWNLPILGMLSFSTIFSGLAIFYYYRDCDPVLNGRIMSRDQIMPLFALDTMGNNEVQRIYLTIINFCFCFRSISWTVWPLCLGYILGQLIDSIFGGHFALGCYTGGLSQAAVQNHFQASVNRLPVNAAHQNYCLHLWIALHTVGLWRWLDGRRAAGLVDHLWSCGRTTAWHFYPRRLHRAYESARRAPGLFARPCLLLLYWLRRSETATNTTALQHHRMRAEKYN